MTIYDEVKSIELFEQSASVLPRTDLEDFQKVCEYVCVLQRAINWWIGDLAAAAERQHPTTHFQAWPEWASPDMIARCKAISEAYSETERNLYATWTTHMHLAKRPDRVEAVQLAVEDGLTSDAVRKNPPQPVVEEEKVEEVVEQEAPAETQEQTVEEPKPPAEPELWLMVVDVNYLVVRAYASGMGIEAANTVVQWLLRLIERLRPMPFGLTDVVCAMDSTTNHRKTLTAEWEAGYKNRTKKTPDLVEQLQLAPQLLAKHNLPVVSLEGMEADDIMASYAKQFPGRVTLFSGDKDMRQCLSANCNILDSVKWEEHPETGNQVPVYNWIIREYKPPADNPTKEKPPNVSCHMTDGDIYNSTHIVGITPELWSHFQALCGDSVDNIKGCPGIGAKKAMELILAHGTMQAVIAACKDGTADLSAKDRMSVLDFESVSEVMLKLTTLRTDLPVPMTTRLCLTGSAS